ncbi:MAG: 5'-methylthioadenosine/S-adenosylhomocysteine nucleosidase [Eubacteriaceae bacterium]|nr:5'-methylthioadenosine/S-adenosylhomocysteine nucleosidase [Eubacteriaceae bacterium]
MIGIGASMEGELSELRKALKHVGEKKAGCFAFDIYEYEAREVAVGVCGTGKVSAAAFCQAMIIALSPSLIVNIGTAGSISGNVVKKDLVVATDAVQHDYDISAFGYEKGELAELRAIGLECDRRFVEVAKNSADGMRVHFGRVLTADRVVVEAAEAEALASAFGGISVDMETAAFAMVCRMNDTPFAGIRGISDDGEGNRHEDFMLNIGSVAELSAKLLLNVLKGY